MPKAADILRRAGAMLGDTVPGTKAERRPIVGPHDERMDFDELDCEFWSLACADTFFRKRSKFVSFADAYATTV